MHMFTSQALALPDPVNNRPDIMEEAAQ